MIELEARALESLAERLDDAFAGAVEILFSVSGKIAVAGLGKSGIAAKKIAATLSSTGSPALFLHAGEAVHGDLGVITPGDAVIAISYSGETREVIEMIPRLRFIGAPVIALTGNPTSTLATLADQHLDVSAPNHPWPFGIIPTSSNATTVAIGDAIAIALLVRRGMTEADFALLHPGGLLGRKMLVKVRDLMHTGPDLPTVRIEATMEEAVMKMSQGRLGLVCIVERTTLRGIITDGDLRRLVERRIRPFDETVASVMTRNPKTAAPDLLAASALRLMESHSITSLPVTSESGVLLGVVHMHDIVRLEAGR